MLASQRAPGSLGSASSGDCARSGARADEAHILALGKDSDDQRLADHERIAERIRRDPAREQEHDAVDRPQRVVGDDRPDDRGRQDIAARDEANDGREGQQA